MTEQILEIKNKILPILQHHQVLKAGLFGSLVRGDMRVDSDIDILVELPPNQSLLDLVALKLDLEDELKKSVDLVEYPMLYPLIRDRILNEEVKVL
jgi:predicted nucleotidyltransferase